ncbi:hypothetical protein VZT92_005447 [Zoarces viviparus]|uniref:Uncharacterized protein n=1 Tax=Zoarces viviparus TaxID=48416 RepID=A0AAW1FSE3_ZOAVI
MPAEATTCTCSWPRRRLPARAAGQTSPVVPFLWPYAESEFSDCLIRTRLYLPQTAQCATPLSPPRLPGASQGHREDCDGCPDPPHGFYGGTFRNDGMANDDAA